MGANTWPGKQKPGAGRQQAGLRGEHAFRMQAQASAQTPRRSPGERRSGQRRIFQRRWEQESLWPIFKAFTRR